MAETGWRMDSTRKCSIIMWIGRMELGLPAINGANQAGNVHYLFTPVLPQRLELKLMNSTNE